MSLKWTGNRSESGILRKSEFKEKKEELFVFGYSCKLFREDEKALHIDQGKHLIPWMGDETLKIDRYDARGALHDLSTLEAPPGGFDWRVELTKSELDVEQLCDEERYRALHTDEDEEEMYKEEELKRLHAAGYGQVGFNYDTPKEPEPAGQPVEVDEPFLPTLSFKTLLPADTVVPESLKQNAIIEKTAKFIASQGTQMEILIKAKQGDNPQFKFLNKDSTLNPYYTALIGLVKAGKWPEKTPEIIDERPPENEEYLHPSLASAVIESAPSIPSIHYKPSADCDYTMLISKMRGDCGDGAGEEAAGPVAPGEVAPPGTEPLPPPAPRAHISRAPMLYKHAHEAAQLSYQQHYAAYYQQYMASVAAAAPPPARAAPPPPLSTGLSLMRNYNTDSDTDDSDFDDTSSADSKGITIAIPPEDVQVVIDKMAAYVARNGDEFAEIVRAKNDPRFTFLEPDNIYHPYYKKLMNEKRGGDVNGVGGGSKSKAPVSFSIKKLKEPDPILPKPALPYESSSEDESEKQEKTEEPKEALKPTVQPLYPLVIPPVVVYKIESQISELPARPVEPAKLAPSPVPEVKPEVDELPKVNEVPKVNEIPEEKEAPKESEAPKEREPSKEKEPSKEIEAPEVKEPEVKSPPVEQVHVKSPLPEIKQVDKSKNRESPRKEKASSRVEKRRHRDKKKEYRSKSESRDLRRHSVEKEKRREKIEREKEISREKEGERREKHVERREKKRRRHSKEEMESEVISLVDNSEDLIDLTGDQSDSKGEIESEADKCKQMERRRRAAEFLKKVGVDPAAAALPATSLASAMVDTLESLRKKKAEEEEKRRKREKRRHRDRYDYEDGSERSHRSSKRKKYKSSDENGESDYDGIKKKKRKKDKKHSSRSKKKRRRETEIEEEIVDQPLNIDLTNTLKVLRKSSPTKDLVQDIDDSTQHSLRRQSNDEERQVRREKKKKEREYSEGEWSSDSDQDSGSTISKIDE